MRDKMHSYPSTGSRGRHTHSDPPLPSLHENRAVSEGVSSAGGGGGGTDDRWAALREHCASGRVKQRSFTGCHDGSMFSRGEGPQTPPAEMMGSTVRRRVKTQSMPVLFKGIHDQEATAEGGEGDRWAALREHCASGRVKQRSFAGTDHEFLRAKEPEKHGEFFDPGILEGLVRRKQHRLEVTDSWREERQNVREESGRKEVKDEKGGMRREQTDEGRMPAPEEARCQCILL